MIIEIPLCFRHSKPAGKNRCGEVFCAGFAVASGNCDHIQLERLPVIGGELLVRLQGVLCANEREILWHVSFPIGINDRTGCASYCRSFYEIVSIEIFAPQRDEQFAALNRARIRADLIDDNSSVAG